MSQLEDLKNKYASVLRLIERKGLKLKNVHIENDKLLIRAAAGSAELKNEIWEQIKLVDPKYTDLVADIQVDPAMAPASPTGAARRTYTVQSGDTLSKIAKDQYGDANTYRKIFEANRDQLTDPDKIRPGQVLNIP